jgi:ferredoxin-nitrite reductase
VLSFSLHQINDLGFEAVRDPASGQLLFNVVVGGYFSLKRNIMSVPLGVAVTEDQLIPFTLALLRVFRCGMPCGMAWCTVLCYRVWINTL